MNTAARKAKAGIWLLVVGVVAGSLGVPLTVGAAPSNPPLNVDVSSWSAGPVPVDIFGTPEVSAVVTITNEPNVHAVQSGDWSVDIASMPNVHAVQSGTWGVEVTNEPGVQAKQSGDWSVGVDSLPPVAIDGSANEVVVANEPDNPVHVTTSQSPPTPVHASASFYLFGDWDDSLQSTDNYFGTTIYEVPADKWLVITSAEANFRNPITGTVADEYADDGQGMFYTFFELRDDTGTRVGGIDVDPEFRYTVLNPLSGAFQNIFRGTRDCDVLVPPGGSVGFSTYTSGYDVGRVQGGYSITGRLVDNP